MTSKRSRGPTRCKWRWRWAAGAVAVGLVALAALAWIETRGWAVQTTATSWIDLHTGEALVIKQRVIPTWHLGKIPLRVSARRVPDRLSEVYDAHGIRPFAEGDFLPMGTQVWGRVGFLNPNASFWWSDTRNAHTNFFNEYDALRSGARVPTSRDAIERLLRKHFDGVTRETPPVVPGRPARRVDD